MRILIKTGLASLAGLALSSMAVSAAVICNDEGDCWRVKEQSRLQA